VIPVGSPPDDTTQPNVPPAIGPQPPVASGRGVAPPVEPPSNSLELEQEFQKWPGRAVRLPDGSPVPNPYSPNGLLMSPFSDLRDVVDAGRRLRFFNHASDHGLPSALDYAENYIGNYLKQGGTFDYQRRAYSFGKDGFTQLPQFRDVSNFNVGLLWSQTGLPLQLGLWIAGNYAAKHSKNYKPDQPYGLDSQTRQLIELGYRIGTSGAYDSRGGP